MLRIRVHHALHTCTCTPSIFLYYLMIHTYITKSLHASYTLATCIHVGQSTYCFRFLSFPQGCEDGGRDSLDLQVHTRYSPPCPFPTHPHILVLLLIRLYQGTKLWSCSLVTWNGRSMLQLVQVHTWHNIIILREFMWTRHQTHMAPTNPWA